MSLANKQTFNLISSLTICQIMLIHNNVFMNKLVSMKLYFNFIYIYIYIRDNQFIFSLFFPLLYIISFMGLYMGFTTKKSKG